MATVNVHEAKTHLSRLLERALAGEEIVIARAGTPLVRLVPFYEVAEPRIAGTYADRIKIDKAFDDPLPDSDLDAFEGDES